MKGTTLWKVVNARVGEVALVDLVTHDVTNEVSFAFDKT